MQHVSSQGSPRILIRTRDVERWINELDETPISTEGLYGLACSVNEYCGIIHARDTEFLIFGDDPSDIYWLPNEQGGLFIRWVGANSLKQLTKFAIAVSEAGDWEERIEWESQHTDYTLMDTCTNAENTTNRILINLSIGNYIMESKYAESDDVMTIVQNLRRVN